MTQEQNKKQRKRKLCGFFCSEGGTRRRAAVQQLLLFCWRQGRITRPFLFFKRWRIQNCKNKKREKTNLVELRVWNLLWVPENRPLKKRREESTAHRTKFFSFRQHSDDAAVHKTMRLFLSLWWWSCVQWGGSYSSGGGHLALIQRKRSQLLCDTAKTGYNTKI